MSRFTNAALAEELHPPGDLFRVVFALLQLSNVQSGRSIPMIRDNYMLLTYNYLGC